MAGHAADGAIQVPEFTSACWTRAMSDLVTAATPAPRLDQDKAELRTLAGWMTLLDDLAAGSRKAA